MAKSTKSQTFTRYNDDGPRLPLELWGRYFQNKQCGTDCEMEHHPF